MLMHVFQVGVGMTFSGGFIDLFLFGILQGNRKTSWLWILVVGAVYFFMYYFLFFYLIRKLDLKTPGRENSDEVKLYTRADVDKRKGRKEKNESQDEISAGILKGLGGKDNISDVDCCATRLRCTVYRAELVDDNILKATGASGVVHKGNGVQIIYGPRVTVIKSNFEDYLENVPEHVEESEEVEKDVKVIASPITGIAAELSTAPDEGFAGKMMGDGVVVTPTEEYVVAPEDGEVTFVFETKHAIGFTTSDGTALLIHVGIDTVKLDGNGFEVFVKDGQKVKKGQKMLKLDLDYIKTHAPSLCSPILCTELVDGESVRLLSSGKVIALDPLFAIESGELPK